MLSPQLDIYTHLAPRLAGQVVLEVGFGTGLGVVQYAGVAEHVTAIEPDMDAVTFARRTLPLANVTWEHGDILTLNVVEGYQAAVMIEVLEHIPDWRGALERVHDALHEGGALYMTARNAFADLRKNDLHEREWTALELYGSLKEFFPKVTLYDWQLEEPQIQNTRQTPLVAVAVK